MLDFNDGLSPTWEVAPTQEYDLADIKRRLAEHAADIYPAHFPRGVVDHRRGELRCGNTRGDAPSGDGSCVIDLRGPYGGCIRDWSTGEHGDQLDTLRYATGRTGRDLYQYAAGLVGAAPSKPKANGHDEAAIHGDRKSVV